MLTVSLVTLFTAAAAAAFLVLADSLLRGRAAYRLLAVERSRLAKQQLSARVVTFAVWTGEHAPARHAIRPGGLLPAAA